MVPPATGMCSTQPPPTEEVARLQGSPLAPSKIGLFNKPHSSRRNTTDGVPAAGKVGDTKTLCPHCGMSGRTGRTGILPWRGVRASLQSLMAGMVYGSGAISS